MYLQEGFLPMCVKFSAAGSYLLAWCHECTRLHCATVCMYVGMIMGAVGDDVMCVAFCRCWELDM